MEKLYGSVHFMHLRHARHYSQEDMCIIGKEEEEEEDLVILTCSVFD